jgi:hypothetical protein
LRSSKTKSPQAAKPGGFFRSGVDGYCAVVTSAAAIKSATLVTVAIRFRLAASGAGFGRACGLKGGFDSGFVLRLHAFDISGIAVSTPRGTASFSSSARTGAFFMVVPMACALGLGFVASSAWCGGRRFRWFERSLNRGFVLGLHALDVAGAAVITPCGSARFSSSTGASTLFFVVAFTVTICLGFVASSTTSSRLFCFQSSLYRCFVSRGFSFNEAHLAAVAPDGTACLAFCAGFTVMFAMGMAVFFAMAVPGFFAFTASCNQER